MKLSMDFFNRDQVSNCCSRRQAAAAKYGRTIAIAGSPNVGKSVLFERLTGTYVTVSNYPGTTVEVFKGKASIAGETCDIIDTPGIYSFLPITEEERVTSSILLNERPDLLINVVDAKSLERMLPLTLQLVETGLPVILVLNIIDEAEQLGIRFDIPRLSALLGKIPVISTASTTGRGIETLKEVISGSFGDKTGHSLRYEGPLEKFLEEAESIIHGNYAITKRSLAALLLQQDPEASALVSAKEKVAGEIHTLAERLCSMLPHPVSYEFALQRQKIASRIARDTVSFAETSKTVRGDGLSRILISPLTGIPILLVIMYFGIYKFVGDFGAGFLVDFLEGTIFEQNVNPWITKVIVDSLPWKSVQELFVGEYGVITLGLRYAVALILPIVTTFFLAFSILEDTGYLPRLSLLIDRLFKAIGLSGRAAIPMVLGLGCDTMATMVTRTLPTIRERFIATVLLALAIPCSAQLGIIMALFEGKAAALWIWLGVMTTVFLAVGWFASRFVPGEKPSFYMEIPPLRLPRISNVVTKTCARVHWYFKEIFPMFILASVFIWVGQITGLIDVLIRGLEHPIRLLGLPEKSAVSFLFGFFRRDYGAAGFFDMKQAGLLTGNQLVVACVTLTLFLPCVAQFLMTVKERGLKTGIGLSLFVLFFSFGVGYTLNIALMMLGVNL